ncbi:MAG: hypothetical protein LAO19_09135 [Acidobacteriia bacterium]|nr:hypothetical protein [Terriglobia bacterium]
MKIDVETYVTLLEKRLELLQKLAQQFLDCRKDFISMDLDGMYARIAEQEELCRRIQGLDPAISTLQQTCMKQLGLERPEEAGGAENAAWAGRLRQVMKELGEAQTEIGRLNQIHAAYLRRSRRTIHVLMNSLGLNAVTYAPGMGPGVIAAQAGKESA